MIPRALITGAVVALSGALAYGQHGAQYRDYQLGGNLASVSALSGTAAAQAKTLHERPALMQELLWRPTYFLSGSTEAQTDPVRQIVFSFYDDQLFRLVVDYDRQRTAGLTDADLIESISAVYGPAASPSARKRAASAPIDEAGLPVAEWGNADYSLVLYRSGYAADFKLILTSRRLDLLARTAVAQAVRLDQMDAPRREIARQKKEAEEALAAQEKARTANKPVFKP